MAAFRAPSGGLRRRGMGVALPVAAGVVGPAVFFRGWIGCVWCAWLRYVLAHENISAVAGSLPLFGRLTAASAPLVGAAK